MCHADDRLLQGFSVLDLISEFRAARASVMRLWANGEGGHAVTHCEVERFHEALDEALQVSADAFEADLERSREMFLGILGHDMRGPLGALLSGSHVLAGLDTMPPLGANVSARMYSSANRLNGMVNDLLDFTRTRLGKPLPIVKSEGNMGETISAAVAELRARHPSTAIRYETSGDLHGTWDFGRLSQLVSNLSGNAIQHGDRSSPIAVRLQAAALIPPKDTSVLNNRQIEAVTSVPSP